ncbi:hypothetical protein [Haloferula sp.]|uniref:hypothetical protein n=1 Tax=Haloferula sp. TaxID=2497595 RepID=UPI003C73830C
MKLLPPLLAILLSATGFANTESWRSLTKIGQTIQLEAGEVAMVVSVSKPIYLSIDRPEKYPTALRLRPRREVRSNYYSTYDERSTQGVDWHRPFPVAGPCTIRLGTSAVVTMRMVSPPKE